MSEGKRGRPKKNAGEPSYSMRDVEKHDVKVTPIFYDNFYSTADIVANRGSAGSSKSHSVLQVLVYRFCTMQNISILMLRKTLPSMRLSTLPHLRKVFKEFGITNRVKEEKVFLNFLYSPTKDSTNLIHLGSVDDKEKIKCFHPDTDILTKDGFRNIKDIKVGDLVATMNPTNEEQTFVPVTNTYKYKYNDYMYSPNNNFEIDFNVTKNHKIPIKYNNNIIMVNVENLNGGEYIGGYYSRYTEFSGIEKKMYKGNVYCIEVEPYHTVVSKYNNCVMVSGNSSEWNMIWIEEATEFAYDDFKTISLYNRAPNHNKGAKNQVFLSFNPIDEYHWLREKLLLDERTMRINKVEEIHSTYRDNPFLPDDTRRKYDALVDQDINYYRIYGLGEWGKLDSVIYNNWDIVPNDLSIEGEVFFGLDFGYNDPTALVKCTVVGDEVWEEELLYEKGLNNQQLIQRVKEAIPSKLSMRPIFCDTAEPDKIAELKLAGLNAKNANKSVNDGIDFIKRLKIHIIDGSDNIIKEKRSYSWRKDREGHPMDKPIDFMDHLMSAERYALYTPLRRRNLYQCIWL